MRILVCIFLITLCSAVNAAHPSSEQVANDWQSSNERDERGGGKSSGGGGGG